MTSEREAVDFGNCQSTPRLKEADGLCPTSADMRRRLEGVKNQNTEIY